MTSANDLAVGRALEAAGIEFIDENGGGAPIARWAPVIAHAQDDLAMHEMRAHSR
jgi:hypothetical protein